VFKPIRGGKQNEREKSPEVLDFRTFMQGGTDNNNRSSSNAAPVSALGEGLEQASEYDERAC